MSENLKDKRIENFMKVRSALASCYNKEQKECDDIDRELHVMMGKITSFIKQLKEEE